MMATKFDSQERNRKVNIPNADVKRVLVGIPKDHKHIRLVLETQSHGTWIFQEATLAAITRSYLNILLHPSKRISELLIQKVVGKSGYAEHQLIEGSTDSRKLLEELSAILQDSE